ncbi:MAG TPA: class I SAM-dependent methyltransferase, partial [Urbifossiella sp.]|nr:class I SAM-dependent methyltransferase [Urbifossiella sp.]
MPERLTPRQVRERAFYDEYSRGVAPAAISADPVEGSQARPWNPGWYAYGIIRELHAAGARTVLDLGCGTGTSAVRFAQIGYTVTGVDLSAGCLEVAAENARRNGVADRVRLVIGTAESLPLPDRTFDAVVGFDILHHVEVVPAVRECLRVLKPGGTAVFKEWVDVPVVDRLRQLPPARWLFRPTPSIRREVTPDERKL